MPILGEKGRTGELLLRQKQCWGKETVKTEVSVLRAAAHHQQHETGAGFGTATWVLVLGSLGSEKHRHSTNSQMPDSSSVLVLNLVCSLILGLIY